jgi:hypothetical protein
MENLTLIFYTLGRPARRRSGVRTTETLFYAEGTIISVSTLSMGKQCLL